MALELVGGAVLGAAVAELWKAVIDAKASALQPALARLESTLKAMIPRLDQISRLNSQLNLQHPEMEELVSLIINGRALVVKCSKISTINLRKKGQYSKELLDLDNSLSRYFNTILSLDHFKNTKEILVAVKGLEKKLAANIDGGVCNQSESAGKPKEEDLESEVLEAMKLLQDSFKEAAVKLSQDSKKEEKPKEEDLESEVLEAMKLLQDSFKEAAVKLSQNSKKEEIVKSDPKIVEINKSGKEYKKSKSTDGPKESGENSGSGVNYEMPQVITVILKVHMHCEACVQDIKKSIMRTKGVESAEPDLKSSQVTVTGVFDPPKLIEYVYEKTGKHAAIVKQEPEIFSDENPNGCSVM